LVTPWWQKRGSSAECTPGTRRRRSDSGGAVANASLECICWRLHVQFQSSFGGMLVKGTREVPCLNPGHTQGSGQPRAAPPGCGSHRCSSAPFQVQQQWHPPATSACIHYYTLWHTAAAVLTWTLLLLGDCTSERSRWCGARRSQQSDTRCRSRLRHTRIHAGALCECPLCPASAVLVTLQKWREMHSGGEFWNRSADHSCSKRGHKSHATVQPLLPE
jgi:hypothetical protein